MEQLEQCISNQIRIQKEDLHKISSNFQKVELKKGDFFLEPDKVCRKMAFINSGYLRMYDIADGKEITFWIGSAGKFITSLSSFVFETPNHWYIQALSDCTLSIIKRKDHFNLCETTPKWLEFDNHLLAHSFAILEKSMFSQLHTTAQQRLDNLLAEEPALFNHVPLKYIASMLGITAESLSRLRKG